MRALNYNNFNAVSCSADGVVLNAFLTRVQESLGSAEVVESIKKMPGDFKVMVHVSPTGHGSTEAAMLSACRQEMELEEGLSIDCEKVDAHHFLLHFVNPASSVGSRIHPLHQSLDESDELDQYTVSEPHEDLLIAAPELDLSDDDHDADLDFYTVNEPLIEVSAIDMHQGTISDKNYLNTFDDLIRNYQLVSPAVAAEYRQTTKELSHDGTFELWYNLNGIISIVKDNRTNKFWELKA